ncbi:ParA family protein [Rhizobium laguerreae]|uniref:ParA family protein n=1 Tax=Rhizobium laguerreae TaxID=1076926 RepID=UPI00144183D0|nr:ParA family protein [Rhizobium laguerreae]NKN10766.1 AAA family ATPase [Rhizobium laguerreae]
MASKVIAILNMKGGVGKTTMSAHLFRVLYRHKQKKVLLVDLDPQFNLTQCIVKQSDYDDIIKLNKTVLRCFEPAPANDFFAVKISKSEPEPAVNIAKTMLKFDIPKPSRLDLICGNFQLVKYSLLDDHKQLNSAHAYFGKFINKARSEYDIIVLDCNPSSSFITKCALDAADAVISPVKEDKYSVLGVELVDRLFAHLNISPQHLIVINGSKRNAPPSSVETELRAHPKFGTNVLSKKMNHSGILRADQSYTGFATDRKVSWSKVVRQELTALSDELVFTLGI